MEFKLSINEASLIKEAQEKLSKDARAVLINQIDAALHRPMPFRQDDKGGYLYQMITKSIDDKFLTEQTQKVIDGFIGVNWEQYLKEALNTAMKKRAEHMANKAVFSKQGPDGPRNEDLDRAWMDERRPHPLDNMFDSQHMQTGA